MFTYAKGGAYQLIGRNTEESPPTTKMLLRKEDLERDFGSIETGPPIATYENRELDGDIREITGREALGMDETGCLK